MKEFKLKGLTDEAGNELFPAIYENVVFTTKEIAICQEHNGKWGIISNSGLVTLPFVYDKILRLGENYVECYQNGKAAIVMAKSDSSSVIVTEFKYDSVKHVSNEFAKENAHFFLTVIGSVY